MDKEVKIYLAKQPFPQQEICKKLRKILLGTLPNLDESYKLGCLWYGKYYIVGLKDSVNLGFSIKGLPKKDIENFSGTGKLARHLKFKEPKEIKEKDIVKLIKLVDKKASCNSCY